MVEKSGISLIGMEIPKLVIYELFFLTWIKNETSRLSELDF